MPSFIADKHDSLIDRLVERGSSSLIKSSRKTFMLNKFLYL